MYLPVPVAGGFHARYSCWQRVMSPTVAAVQLSYSTVVSCVDPGLRHCISSLDDYSGQMRPLSTADKALSDSTVYWPTPLTSNRRKSNVEESLVGSGKWRFVRKTITTIHSLSETCQVATSLMFFKSEDTWRVFLFADSYLPGGGSLVSVLPTLENWQKLYSSFYLIYMYVDFNKYICVCVSLPFLWKVTAAITYLI